MVRPRGVGRCSRLWDDRLMVFIFIRWGPAGSSASTRSCRTNHRCYATVIGINEGRRCLGKRIGSLPRAVGSTLPRPNPGGDDPALPEEPATVVVVEGGGLSGRGDEPWSPIFFAGCPHGLTNREQARNRCLLCSSETGIPDLNYDLSYTRWDGRPGKRVVPQDITDNLFQKI